MKLKKWLLAPVILLVVVFVVIKFDLLIIKKADFLLDNVPCTNPARLSSEFNLKGRNILLIDEVKLKDKILSKYPCIKSVKVELKFPQEAKVFISGRVPFLGLINIPNKSLSLANLEASPSSESALLDWSFPKTSEKTFVSDEEGLVFSQSDGQNLPKLYLSNFDLKIGTKLDAKTFAKIRAVYTKLGNETTFPLKKTSSNNFLEAKLSGHNLLLQTSPKVVFSLEKDVLRQLASLQLILQKATINEKGIDSIDLRFDKPVITYFPQKQDNLR